jgi:imidazolonepropionase-like amidohydrolase
LREALIKARRYLDEWKRYEAGVERHPPDRDLRMDTLAELLTGNLQLHIHCYRAEEMATLIDLSHEFGFRIAAFHHAVEAYKIAPLLKQEGICAVVWPDWWGFKREAEDGIRENAAFVDAAGGCVTMHSDIPVLGYHLNLEAAKAMAAGRRAGLDIRPEHAIRWITSNPAHALGLDNRIGAIATGMNADLVLWSGDPFSVYSQAEKVFVDGALLFDRDTGQAPPDLMLGQPAREAMQ